MNLKEVLVLLIMCGFLPTTHVFAVDVYKWVAADGTVSFSERPPPSEEPAQEDSIEVLSIADPPVIEEIPDEEKVAEQTVANTTVSSRQETKSKRTPSVKIYTTSTCPYCIMAKSYMNQQGITYTEYNVEKNLAYKAEFKRLGGRGVPFFIVGPYLMKGFSPNALEALRKKASGY